MESSVCTANPRVEVRPPRTGLPWRPCTGEHLDDLVRLLLGERVAPDLGHDLPPVASCRVSEQTTLVHEGAPCEALHVLRYGSMKCVRTLEDGYEQVVSIVQAGDVVGFEALHCDRHPTSVVALEDSSTFVLPRRELPQLQQHWPALANALQCRLSMQLADASAAAELMAAVASEARLARFLLWWSARMAHLGQSPRRLLLRMGRRDIASLIGVAHATVSRAFTSLAVSGCLRVDNRHVDIVDFDALRERARSTRGLAVEAPLPGAADGPAQGGAPSWLPGLAVTPGTPGLQRVQDH